MTSRSFNYVYHRPTSDPRISNTRVLFAGAEIFPLFSIAPAAEGFVAYSIPCAHRSRTSTSRCSSEWGPRIQSTYREKSCTLAYVHLCVPPSTALRSQSAFFTFRGTHDSPRRRKECIVASIAIYFVQRTGCRVLYLRWNVRVPTVALQRKESMTENHSLHSEDWTLRSIFRIYVVHTHLHALSPTVYTLHGSAAGEGKKRSPNFEWGIAP